MTVATYSDVGVALGRPITDAAERQQIDHWLLGIELAIQARLGDVTALDQSVLKYVESEAVAEKARRRGRAESSITVAVDDGSVTRRFDQRAGANDITDEWWALLTPSTDDAGSFTISPFADRQETLRAQTWWRQ